MKLNTWKEIKLMLVGCMLLFLFMGGTTPTNLEAQIPSQKEISEGRKQLEQKGISEDEVESRMKQRGYDVNNLQPEKIPEYQSVLEEVIAELEAEKAAEQREKQEQKQREEAEKAAERREEQEQKQREEAEKSQQDTAKQKPKENIEEKKEEKQEAPKQANAEQKTPKSDIYGHNLFSKELMSLYKADDEGTAPDSYVLGVNDEILISIFGRSQADFRLKINHGGYVQPSNMEKIFLNGLNLKQARELLRTRMARRYSFLPEQFTATLVSARTLTVSIFGEVKHQGSYNISALNTGFNALMAADGLTDQGSVREIKLIKGDGEEKVMDVYQYLTNPKVQFDFPIDDKDVIYVPMAQNIVEINGAVRRPMKYEVLDGETLKDLIEFSGGLRSNAYTELAQISRLAGENRILIDIPLEEYLKQDVDFTLRDGDKITIRQVEGELKKYVEINGYVDFPGQYDFEEGMSLAELIDKARYKDLTRTDLAFLFRENEDKTVKLIKLNPDAMDLDSFKLQERDKLVFYSIRHFMDEQKEIEISGAVRRPTSITFEPEDKVKLADLITYAGGIQPFANGQAMVTRIDRTNRQRVEYLEVDVFRALADTSGAENITLRQGDKVNVFSVEQFTETEEVEIRGEVKDPKALKYDESLDLREAILLAGGLTKNASNIAIIRSRPLDSNKEVSYRNVDLDRVLSGEERISLQARDVVNIYNKDTYLEEYQISIAGEVRNPGEFVYDESLSLNDMIHMAGGLKKNASNIAIIRSYPTDNNKEVSYQRIELDRVLSGDVELELKPKDKIRIYDKNVYMEDFQVSVMGEVREPGKFTFDESLTIKDLVYMAGGLTIKAATNRVDLYRLDIMENEPTQILHKSIELNRENNYDISSIDDVTLQPYDIVIVRPVSDFEFQEVVYINGQVKYPGPYVLDKNKNERLKDIVKRAGGMKRDAFPRGATLVRKSGDKDGNIIIDLRRAVKRGRSYDNIVVRNGDIVYIPKVENTVAIRTTGTLSRDVLADSTLEKHAIQLAFQGEKSAGWYIKNFAGGFKKDADRNSVRVVYPGGRIGSTKRILGIFRHYPTVVEGSTVLVDMKPPKPEKEKKEREDVDWESFARDTLALTTSILTLLVLVNRL